MKGFTRISILVLATLFCAGPAVVFARDIAPLLLASAHAQDADPANETADSDAAEEPANETADADVAEEAVDAIDEIVAPPVEARLIDAVSVVVQNADEEGVEKAKIELSVTKSGDTFKKITDGEGVAKFSQIPAEHLHVKVTAPGYRSYSGDFTLDNGDDPFVIKLKKRD